jgi:hypothetical protein
MSLEGAIMLARTVGIQIQRSKQFDYLYEQAHRFGDRFTNRNRTTGKEPKNIEEVCITQTENASQVNRLAANTRLIINPL